jgi:plasmid stability protein
MQKTTVYLPDDLKRALEHVAADQGRSEAELIREAVQAITRGDRRPRPRLPLFRSGRRGLAERIDRALAGFGSR